jgi:hypothetical protein
MLMVRAEDVVQQTQDLLKAAPLFQHVECILRDVAIISSITCRHNTVASNNLCKMCHEIEEQMRQYEQYMTVVMSILIW